MQGEVVATMMVSTMVAETTAVCAIQASYGGAED